MKCYKCNSNRIGKGIALINSLVSFPDFIGDKPNEFKRGQTVSRSGPPKAIPVNQCKSCGHAWTD